MAREDSTLAEPIAAAVAAGLLDVHTQLRGTVVSYDEGAKTCEVQIGTRLAVPDGNGGTVYQAFPNLTHVPVAWPSAGGFMLHFPLPVGSSVFVSFDEQDAQQWETNGERADPKWLERFPLASALAHPYSRTPIATSGANMPCPSPFSFGNAAAAHEVTRDDLLQSLISDLVTWVQTGVAPSGGGPVTYGPFSPSATAASKLKAE